MIKFIKQHERLIKETLDKNPDAVTLHEFLEYHNRQITWLAHERLAHAIVMLFVCLFMLLALGFSLVKPSLPIIAVTALLLILTVAYLYHYFRLENTVQHWYTISNELWKRLT
jgi:Ca2+/Na+ antiporter